MTARNQLLSSLIGTPWRANSRGPDAFDCWSLVVHLQRELFSQSLPAVSVPEAPSWPWMIWQFSTHCERQNWKEIPPDPMGLARAPDGAIALMARTSQVAHAGLWLVPENRIIHADQDNGVLMEDLATLKMKGWRKIVLLARV